MIKQPWKVLGFIWALPLTLVGLAYVLVLGARWMYLEGADWSLHFFCPDGGRGQRWLWHYNVGGQTIGSTIIYSQAMDITSQASLRMMKHERVHVRQGMKFGPLDPIIYYMMSLFAWLYDQDIYRGNLAEMQARYESGEVQQPDDLKPRDHSHGL